MSDPETKGKPDDPLDTGHDYDGIREYDNKLPNWWLATFFGTVLFGYGYFFYYQVLDSTPRQADEYRAEMDAAAQVALVAARARGGVSDESLLALKGLSTASRAGETTFKQLCASCHGASAQGIVGPNLTDAYWLHGARPTQILKAVSDGVVSKGMPAWGQVLGADKAESVVAYLLTVKGTNVPGKAPQGEPTTEQGDAQR